MTDHLIERLADSALAPISNHCSLDRAAEDEPLGTVLLVEDEDPIREIASVMISILGYRVIPVASGAEALLEFRKANGSIDVVITDVRMPRMNGLQLVESLREIDAAVKTIFMSGFFSEAFQLPPDVIRIQKPFFRSILAAKLAEALGTTPSTPDPDRHPLTISAQ
jgi:two-component system cell cycle sensor histidine kinase/response regulator CckA